MNTKHFFRNVIGAVFSLSLLIGIACLSASTAQAQYPYGQDRDYRREQEREYRREQERREREREREQQYRRNQNYGVYNNGGYYGGYGNNPYNTAQSLGYRDGYAQGDSDAAYGRPYNPTGGRVYRDGTEGYSSYYGNKGAYKQAFQQAFLNGYNEAYQRRGGNRNRGYYGRYPY